MASKMVAEWYHPASLILIEQLFSHQPPCRTAKELNAAGTDLIPSTTHELAGRHGQAQICG
jgi:hypothetical protein